MASPELSSPLDVAPEVDDPWADLHAPLWGLTTPLWLAPLRVPLALVLICVRLPLLLALLLVEALVFRLAIVGARVPTRLGDAPLAAWRSAVIRGATMVIQRLWLWCVGVWCVERETAPGADLATPHKLIVANHIGYIEIWALQAWFAPGFVAKRGMLDLPVLGSMAAAAQNIFVDRASAESRHATGDCIAARADPASPFPPCAIFPEGTTTNGTSVIQMQRGAFRPGHAVRALAFACPFGHTGFNPCWGARGEGGAHLLGLMAQPVNRLRCVDLGVLVPSDAERADAALFARRAQAEIARAAGAAVSPLSLYDGGFVVKKPARDGDGGGDDAEAGTSPLQVSPLSDAPASAPPPSADDDDAAAAPPPPSLRGARSDSVHDSLEEEVALATVEAGAATPPTPELARKVSSHSVHLGDAEAGEIETMVDVAGISARVNALSPTEKEEVVGQFWDRRTSQSGMVGV